MASSTGRRLFVSRDPSVLERVRTGLTFPGAPPSAPSGTALDSTSALGRVNLSVLGLAIERLQSGPASAVDDLPKLYAAGLPEGLPGNLLTVAMNERPELLARLARVAVARKAKDAIRQASGAVTAQCYTRRLGAYDQHAPPAPAAAAPLAAASEAKAADALRAVGERARLLSQIAEAKAQAPPPGPETLEAQSAHERVMSSMACSLANLELQIELEQGALEDAANIDDDDPLEDTRTPQLPSGSLPGPSSAGSWSIPPPEKADRLRLNLFSPRGKQDNAPIERK